ncbi:hypothetical protein NQ315_017422 [Exocentrus adspersus]|uniref:Uncharacterized protein n=1 Tax=Exocentrus adspersus TaxID=1586481 RepID=A0AAV8VKL8_9CUCU|nr:hypothetical protein NQ315_017422 [Exocentrus adspersus]
MSFFMLHQTPMYGDKATVLYTDTYNLILEIINSNPYEHIKSNIQYFDTSNLIIKRSIVGKMKDEYAGRPIKAFYGTGAKAYSVKAGEVTKKVKGISKSVIKHNIELNDYAQVVENEGIIFRKMYGPNQISWRTRIKHIYIEQPKHSVTLLKHKV